MGVGVSVLVVETTLLGSSDLRVSRIALGCMSYGDPGAGLHSWTLDEEAAQPFFRQAVELGVTFWDTANVYQQGTSEEYVGRAVRRYARRQDIVLATKVFGRMHDGPTGGGLSRAAIHAQCDASLRRLGTDHIDVYVIHRFDEAVPVEETMAALHELVVAGKVRHLGASSMWAWQFAKLQTAALAATAGRRSPRCRTSTTCSNAKRSGRCCRCAPTMGVGVVPYSPQGKGRLTRPWGQQTARASVDEVAKAFDSPADQPIIEATEAVARDRGVPMAQVALAWVLSKPVVTAPIVGATKPHHLTDAVAALDLTLTPDEIQRLEAPYVPQQPYWW